MSLLSVESIERCLIGSREHDMRMRNKYLNDFNTHKKEGEIECVREKHVRYASLEM